VYWMDFKGREDHRGTLCANGGNWTQTTWIGHPWVFRDKASQRILLHFVPYRVIPSTTGAVMVGKDTNLCIHTFSIVSPRLGERDAYGEVDNAPDAYMCGVEDHIFLYPSTKLITIENAVQISICQMYKIIEHPTKAKYRQIRTSNGTFLKIVWCNSGRGVLHAMGFVENGLYAEMGPPSSNDALDGGGTEGEGGNGNVLLLLERRRHILEAILLLENYTNGMNGNEVGGNGEDLQQEQPRGVGGAGRAGWGY